MPIGTGRGVSTPESPPAAVAGQWGLVPLRGCPRTPGSSSERLRSTACQSARVAVGAAPVVHGLRAPFPVLLSQPPPGDSGRVGRSSCHRSQSLPYPKGGGLSCVCRESIRFHRGRQPLFLKVRRAGRLRHYGFALAPVRGQSQQRGDHTTGLRSCQPRFSGPVRSAEERSTGVVTPRSQGLYHRSPVSVNPRF